MRTTLFTALMATVLIFSSCKKEEEEEKNENIKKHYQGNWEMETQDGGPDTTFIITINSEGNFFESINFDGFVGDVEGNVNNDGNVTGTIKAFNTGVGILNGNLTTSGTGSGYYIITVSNDTIAWTAVKL